MNLTAKQHIRIDILSKYLSGELYYQDAMNALEIKERQFRRLVKRFRQDGVLSVLHGNLGKVPPNKTDYKLRNQIVSLYRTRYRGLNVSHFIEKLEDHNIKNIPSYTTIRSFLLEEKLISIQVKRARKSRPMRRRYEKEGAMIQIDGSHHRWIAGKLPCCLTLAIDDATGKLMAAKFTKTETTFAAMDVVEEIIKKNGAFQMLYSDKAGIYGGGKRDNYSQMNRALAELGIVSVQANTPQAKGRIERAFRTLQGRLVAEFKLNNVKTIDEANRYLKSVYIKKFNEKFSIIPTSPLTAYQKIPSHVDLNESFCMKEERIVQNGEIISYQGNKYLLKVEDQSSFKKVVEIREYRSGDLKIFLKGVEIEYEIFEMNSRVA